LSSTTDPVASREAARGQILVIFAGGLVVMLLIAALVFDVGQNLLDRRTEQNVADAAALAGARFLPAAYTYHGPCSAAPAAMPAVTTACDVAVASGYVDGSNNKSVRVDIPPVAPSVHAGLGGHVEVTIGATRPSFFQGVMGVFIQRTGAMGVATNGTDIALPYSIIALDPHGCGTNFINGAPGTSVTTNGTVHVDSDCASAALKLAGNGVLTAPECDVVGGIQVSGGATNHCAAAPTGILVYGDPLRNLPVPTKPALPAAVQALDTPAGPIPTGCPGSGTPASDSAPQTCAFSSGQVAGKSYRLFPGDYPGGISTSKATLYLSPGIYWLGGGGLHIQSDGKVVSKDIGDNTCCTPSGGVLLYNGVDPVPSSGCTGAGCYQSIDLNGGGGSTPTLALRPMQSGQYQNMVIFIDRVAATGNADVSLNGANSDLTISGTIYAPTGNIRLNGSNSDSIGTQLICYNFQLNGSGAAFTLNYSPDQLFHLKGVGLVE
jgi:hypothetical protein